MNKFVQHGVLSEYKTIGDQLRLTRINAGLSIENVARRLKVKAEYIKALEDEDYSKLPSGFYSRVFLKKYINFLKLDYRKIVKNQAVGNLAEADKDGIFSKKIVRSSKLMIFPRIFRNLLMASIILVVLFYFGFYLKKIVTPPNLEILEPVANQVQKELTASVFGLTEPESEVAINGQTVLIDRAGNFREKINLKKGINIVVISSKKKHSREQVVTRQILVE
jgi:cytoskeletal protein RodZ